MREYDIDATENNKSLYVTPLHDGITNKFNLYDQHTCALILHRIMVHDKIIQYYYYIMVVDFHMVKKKKKIMILLNQ